MENDQVKAKFAAENAAEKYRPTEACTRHFARILVEKSGVPQFEGPVNVLDFATGTGVVVHEIYQATPKDKWDHLKVLGGDVSPVMVDYLVERAKKEGWTGLEGRIVDGMKDLDLPQGSFTHIFMSFAVFAMPGILPKLQALLKPGGYLGITTWASLLWSELLPRCISQMKDKPYCPTTEEVEGKLYMGQDWGNGDFAVSQLRDAGLTRVDKTRSVFEGGCFTPGEFVDMMQLPLTVIVAFWEEEKRKEWLEELNQIMKQELVNDAGGEDQIVMSTFDCNVVWGWKA